METISSTFDRWLDAGLTGGEVLPANTEKEYRAFFSAMGKCSMSHLEQISEAAKDKQRSIGDHYRLHVDLKNQHASRRLDPIPYMIGASEWRDVEQGLSQRARLFERILQDLLGKQLLFRDEVIPEELFLRNPGTWPALIDPRRRPPPSLVIHGADLTRGPDGRMIVLRDHIQSPRGFASTLASRTILAKLCSKEIRQMGVHRLAQYFRYLREGLAQLGANTATNRSARIVVLSPGGDTDDAFEHGYLAAYLGYTLVQGQDLLVRDGHVWIKALDGLRKVDVVLRFVADTMADPLELDSSSSTGVAGLVEIHRQEQIAIANPIGSAILESPGLLPFLPSVCTYLLGESLRLPHRATWWCGQRKERQHVLANLDHLQIQRVDQSPTPVPLDQLAEAIKNEPWCFVAQEPVVAGAVPSLDGGGTTFVSRAASYRAFTFRGAVDFEVMPGGLATSLGSAQGGQEDPWVKDVWVQSEHEISDPVSLWRSPGTLQPQVTGLFTSRIVEHLYWCGRYAERTASLTRSLSLLASGDAGIDLQEGYPSCPRVLWEGVLEQAGWDPKQTVPEPSLKSALDIFNPRPQVDSISQSLSRFCWNASAVREIWAQGQWDLIRTLKQLSATIPVDTPGPVLVRQFEERLDRISLNLQALSGSSHDSMTRTPGWHFFRLGRLLERGIKLAELLHGSLDRIDSLRGSSEEIDFLNTLLLIQENLITYRRTYRTEPEFPAVMFLLLADEDNPHSSLFVFSEIMKSLHLVHRDFSPDTRPLANPVQLMRKLEQLRVQGQHWQCGTIKALVVEVIESLEGIHGQIDHIWFKHRRHRYQPLPLQFPVPETNPAVPNSMQAQQQQLNGDGP